MMTLKDKLAALYDDYDYNHRYFEGQLPPVSIHVCERRETQSAYLKVAEYDRAAGAIYFYLSDRDLSDGIIHSFLRGWLLHEMVHVAVPEDAHGARFRAELQRIAEAGDQDAEREVWLIVGNDLWDDGWIGDESGRWERDREEEEEEDTQTFAGTQQGRAEPGGEP